LSSPRRNLTARFGKRAFDLLAILRPLLIGRRFREGAVSASKMRNHPASQGNRAGRRPRRLCASTICSPSTTSPRGSALLDEIDQAEAMTAIAGHDRAFWHDGIGLFPANRPLASDPGIEILRKPAIAPGFARR
jgi:hypothetical protein